MDSSPDEIVIVITTSNKQIMCKPRSRERGYFLVEMFKFSKKARNGEHFAVMVTAFVMVSAVLVCVCKNFDKCNQPADVVHLSIPFQSNHPNISCFWQIVMHSSHMYQTTEFDSSLYHADIH